MAFDLIKLFEPSAHFLFLFLRFWQISLESRKSIENFIHSLTDFSSFALKTVSNFWWIPIVLCWFKDFDPRRFFLKCFWMERRFSEFVDLLLNLFIKLWLFRFRFSEWLPRLWIGGMFYTAFDFQVVWLVYLAGWLFPNRWPN